MSRENQKRRTRNAILAAAAELVRAGRQPTVAEVADAAEVSRATAYGYFRTQQELLLEVALEIREREALEAALEAALAECGDDVSARWVAFCRLYHDMFVRNEAIFRAMLRAQLDAWLDVYRQGTADSVVVRQARRLPLLDGVLAPLAGRVPERDYRRLIESLAMVSGIEALVVLKDLCGVTSEQALDRMLWAGTALIETTRLPR
jgi:AcrR family transcriptional regulator